MLPQADLYKRACVPYTVEPGSLHLVLVWNSKRKKYLLHSCHQVRIIRRSKFIGQPPDFLACKFLVELGARGYYVYAQATACLLPVYIITVLSKLISTPCVGKPTEVMVSFASSRVSGMSTRHCHCTTIHASLPGVSSMTQQPPGQRLPRHG
jgi:hypothetical protein